MTVQFFVGHRPDRPSLYSRRRKFSIQRQPDPPVASSAGTNLAYPAMELIPAALFFSCSSRWQFIPTFLTQSKTRIKELRQELGAMPSALTSDNETWEAYRAVISQVEVELKEVLVSGSDIATMNIVPDVTAMYREFADDIRKVRSYTRHGLSGWPWVQLEKRCWLSESHGYKISPLEEE